MSISSSCVCSITGRMLRPIFAARTTVDIKKIFDLLPGRYIKGTAEKPMTYYFSIGNDKYTVLAFSDVIIEAPDGGIDTVETALDGYTLPASVENLTLEAARQGFVFAQVNPEIVRNEGEGTLNITYNLVEGTRTYIERIDIVGNFRTEDQVIRRELQLFEGDAFNRVLVDRARRRLTALDFFSKIDFREDIVNGVIKSLVFGWVVTWIALFEGYDATPTSEGVSRASQALNPSKFWTRHPALHTADFPACGAPRIQMDLWSLKIIDYII